MLMPTVGIEKLYVAKLNSDTVQGLSYTTPQYFDNVQRLGIKPKTNTEKAYAENRIVDQVSEFDSADVEFDRYSMSTNERAFILGQTISANGGVVASQGDEPPFIALLYKAPIRLNGAKAYRYGVIYKALFTPPDEEMKGLEGKPDLSQTPKISGTAQSTAWSFKDSNGKSKHPWEYHIDTTNNLDDTWFAAVPIPSVSTYTALSLASSIPATNATGITAATTPSLTFSNAISYFGDILLLNATDGSLVANTMALDDSKKILTITPNSALVSGKVYNVVVSGVTDIYGQVLPGQIVKFTTA
jgi:phi13 family phage major tail protein